MPALLPTSASVCRRTHPDSTPTNCVRLMQWNANRISGKIAELLTLLHSNNVNIAAIQETKLTIKTKLLKTALCATVRLDRHKTKAATD